MFDRHLQEAQWLDSNDPLRHYKSAFYLQPETVYLDGNSLGLLSKNAERTLLEVLEQWKTHAIDGWQKGPHPWFNLSEQLGERVAPLIGASGNEVIVTGSTTANLHQILASFYQPQGSREIILADRLTFPSDLYAISSHLTGQDKNPVQHLRLIGSPDDYTLNEDEIIEAMTDEVAIAVLPSVLYRSGQLLDVERLTSVAHDRGILVAFDLCHSIGAAAHELSKWNVDFAFWCHYKYLNAGPGSVAGLYVNQRHHGRTPGLAGWFSSEKSKQFDMTATLNPSAGVGAFQIGTPHVLSLAPLIGSLELFEECGITAIRNKSLQLTDYLMRLMDTELEPYGFDIVNPRESHQRGGHVALLHKDAARIAKALKEARVIPDFRAPNIIRLAPISLYTSFEDVLTAVTRLAQIMETKQYLSYANERDVIA